MGKVPMKKAQEIRRRKPTETRCNYCKRSIRGSEITADHVVPIIAGGGHGWDNIIWCCVICNTMKSGMHVDRFLRAIQLVPVSHEIPLGLDPLSREIRRRYQSYWTKAVRIVEKILDNTTLTPKDHM